MNPQNSIKSINFDKIIKEQNELRDKIFDLFEDIRLEVEEKINDIYTEKNILVEEENKLYVYEEDERIEILINPYIKPRTKWDNNDVIVTEKITISSGDFFIRDPNLYYTYEYKENEGINIEQFAKTYKLKSKDEIKEKVLKIGSFLSTQVIDNIIIQIDNGNSKMGTKKE